MRPSEISVSSVTNLCFVLWETADVQLSQGKVLPSAHFFVDKLCGPGNMILLGMVRDEVQRVAGFWGRLPIGRVASLLPIFP